MSGLDADGEELRKAVRWISERRTAEPGAKLSKLIDEASLRFDLSPQQAQFLLDQLARNPAKDER